MKKLIFFLFICLSGLSLNAQSQDSIFMLWQDNSQTDSIRIKAYKEYIWNGYLFSVPDSALLLIEAMHTYGEVHNYPKAVNQAYTLQSISYELQGNFTKALEYAEKSIAGNKAIGNKAGISEAEIVIGVLLEEQGIYPQALEHYNKALAIDEEINNKEGIAMSLNNIGNIFSKQGNNIRSLEYYQKALAIDEELGVKQGIAIELNNIGEIYKQQGDTTKALTHFERSLKINKEIDDKYGLATTYISIGTLYQEKGKKSLALEYYKKALGILEEFGMLQEIANTQIKIGTFYLEKGEYKLALEYCQKANTTAQEIGALDIKKNSCDCLYYGNKKLGNIRKALANFEEMAALNDSLYNEENTRKLTRVQMQYEFSKKEAANKAEQEKKDAIVLKELQHQKLVRNSFIAGFTIVLLFAGMFFVQRNRIGKEKQRSEELLLNILPEETAKELKENGHSDAKLVDHVTVLFTDFKDFTTMSEKLSPSELVKDLHTCFSLFDQICEKYGVEKIKTIGDAYMAAGGLPTPNLTHAQDVVKAALEMAQVVEDGKAKKIAAGLPYFEVRIGVHTGPVVAGIVGIKKFQYDIWGDTVNIASRMESSGVVGQVNISQSTYSLLKTDPKFNFKKRGEIAVKGKGKLEMFFVNLNV